MAKTPSPGQVPAAKPEAVAKPTPAKAFIGADERDFQRFLPEDVRAEILRGLRRVPFDSAGLARLPSVQFVSSEASFPSFETGRRVYVLDRAFLVQHDRFDYWILHQTVEEGAFTDTTRFVIVVDTEVVPRKAYYLEFEEDEVGPGLLPRPKGFTTSCFICHPSGPRIFRPQVSNRAPPLNEMDRGLLNSWNKIIVGYWEVETYVPIALRRSDPSTLPETGGPMKPPPGYEVPMREPGDESNAPLRMTACLGCHAEGSGVRGPLVAQNAETILNILHYPVDPDFTPRPVPGTEFTHPFDELAGAGLTAFEQECLLRWLDPNQPTSQASPGCRDPARPSRPAPAPPPSPNKSASLWLDPDNSTVEADAATILGTISVRDFGLSGALKCASTSPRPARCKAEFIADLAPASTGIELRDAHLRTYLKVRQLPLVVVQLDDVGWEQVTATPSQSLTAEVEIAGHSAPYDVHVKCEPLSANPAPGFECQLQEFQLLLSKHSLEPHAYLGLAVKDAVKIRGKLTFRPPAAARPR